MRLTGRSRVRQWAGTVRRDPGRANDAVGAVFLAIAIGLFVATALDAWLPVTVDRFLPGLALALGALFRLSGYGFRWHARHTFEGASRSDAFGIVGAGIGACGAVVLPVVPVLGIGIAVTGLAIDTLGISWGNFVYYYRKHRT